MQAFYIPDNRNGLVRFIDSSGIISTLAFTCTDPVFISSGFNPWSVAIDRSGQNLFVVDESSEVVWAIDLATLVMTRIAGRGAAGWHFSDIYGIATDSKGNVYVSDPAFQVIVAINMQSTTQNILGVSIPAGQADFVVGSVSTGTGFSGDGGLATSAWVNSPYGLALDASDNLLFCDQLNNRIRRVDATTGIISTVVGSGAFGGGSGSYSGDGGSPTSATLNQPIGIAVDPAGNFYICDTFNNVIRVVNNQGTTQTLLGRAIAANTIETVAGPTANVTDIMWFCDCDDAGNLGFCNPVRHSPPGGNIWEVTSAGAVVSIAGTGTFGTATGDGGPALSARIGEAFGLAFVPTAPALSVTPSSMKMYPNYLSLNPSAQDEFPLTQNLTITASVAWTCSSDVPWTLFNGDFDGNLNGNPSISGSGNATVSVSLETRPARTGLPQGYGGRIRTGQYSGDLTITNRSDSVVVPVQLSIGYGDSLD